MTLTQSLEKIGEDGVMAGMDEVNRQMRAEVPARVDDDD